MVLTPDISICCLDSAQYFGGLLCVPKFVLLCVRLVPGSAEPPIVGVSPFESGDQASSTPGFDIQERYNFNICLSKAWSNSRLYICLVMDVLRLCFVGHSQHSFHFVWNRFLLAGSVDFPFTSFPLSTGCLLGLWPNLSRLLGIIRFTNWWMS